MQQLWSQRLPWPIHLLGASVVIHDQLATIPHDQAKAIPAIPLESTVPVAARLDLPPLQHEVWGGS